MITTLQLLIFVAYVTFLLVKFKGPLPSISDSWYELPRKQKNLFTFFCWSLGLLMVFQGKEQLITFFFAGVGFFWVGAATMFKRKITGRLHYLGASMAIILSLISIGIEGGVWYPLILWVVSSGLIKGLKINNDVWWIEIAAFVTIILGLYQI